MPAPPALATYRADVDGYVWRSLLDPAVVVDVLPVPRDGERDIAAEPVCVGGLIAVMAMARFDRSLGGGR